MVSYPHPCGFRPHLCKRTSKTHYLYTFTTNMGQIHNRRDKSSKPKQVLLVTYEFSFGEIEKLLKDLKHQHPHIQVEILGKKPFDSLPPETLQATKYILGFNNFPTPEQVPNLEFVQLFSAGANHLPNCLYGNGKWMKLNGVPHRGFMVLL